MRKAAKPTYVLGIYMGHNSTALLLKDGEVIAAASEERFNNIKNYVGFPKNAIDYLLQEANIASKELSLVTLPYKYGSPIHASRGSKKNILISLLVVVYTSINFLRMIWGRAAFLIPSIRPVGRFFYCLSAKTIGRLTVEKEREFLANYFGIEKEKVRAYDHHLCHAASTYYASGFNKNKALVLTIDGEGDTFSASVNILDNDRINILARTPRESSPGLLYAYLTLYLGMKPNEHEYKVMGLAPYASKEAVENIYKRIKNIILVDRENLIFKSAFNTIDTEKFLEIYMKHVRFDIIAGSFQKLLEEKVTELVKEAIKKTNIKTVVLAGGVLMNVKINKKILELKEVDRLFVVPSCGDETSILGSCYLGYIEELKIKKERIDIKPIREIYWGPKFSDSQIKEALKNANAYNKYKIKQFINIETRIADLISRGNIVARLAGRMEFGARALGNRSILADPRNTDVIRIINDQIKGRDFWMPFAPSVLEERAKDYIITPKFFEGHYMMMAFDTTEKGRKDLKAAMHQYDFTVRAQIVKADFNPQYYKVIKEFERLTGVGALLNTSFNLHGYPIVLGPKEALKVFENSGLTHLAIENYLITKNI